VSLSWQFDIAKTTQPDDKLIHSRLIIKFKKALSFMGLHYIKLSCDWFWHWLSWCHYNL